ncbi:MAG: BTAD domain-containing putative transcriptional regulator [Roseiflexaceae bacterium]
MVPMLHIQFLGGFRLRLDDTPVTALDHPRLQALLAYLVLRRAMPQTRQQLAFLLWPDSSETQARTNLRTLLHRLRQALPHADQFLYVDSQVVQWRPTAHWTLDVADFEQALAQTADQGGNGPVPGATLLEAVELYSDDLLPGWYDDWVLLEREQLRERFLKALEQLIELLEGEHDYVRAITSAQRLLRYDPLHELTYQRLMRLHMLSDDRASALRTYQTCATVLERELGVEPSAATRAVYEQVLRIEAPAGPPNHLPVTAPPLGDPQPARPADKLHWAGARAGRGGRVACHNTPAHTHWRGRLWEDASGADGGGRPRAGIPRRGLAGGAGCAQRCCAPTAGDGHGTGSA